MGCAPEMSCWGTRKIPVSTANLHLRSCHAAWGSSLRACGVQPRDPTGLPGVQCVRSMQWSERAVCHTVVVRQIQAMGSPDSNKTELGVRMLCPIGSSGAMRGPQNRDSALVNELHGFLAANPLVGSAWLEDLHVDIGSHDAGQWPVSQRPGEALEGSPPVLGWQVEAAEERVPVPA